MEVLYFNYPRLSLITSLFYLFKAPYQWAPDDPGGDVAAEDGRSSHEHHQEFTDHGVPSQGRGSY